jgi:hypothetical protein
VSEDKSEAIDPELADAGEEGESDDELEGAIPSYPAKRRFWR